MSIVNLKNVRERTEKANKPQRLNIPIDADLMRKIQKIKDVAGIRNTTDLIRGIIEEIYEDVMKQTI